MSSDSFNLPSVNINVNRISSYRQRKHIIRSQLIDKFEEESMCMLTDKRADDLVRTHSLYVPAPPLLRRIVQNSLHEMKVLCITPP